MNTPIQFPQLYQQEIQTETAPPTPQHQNSLFDDDSENINCLLIANRPIFVLEHHPPTSHFTMKGEQSADHLPLTYNRKQKSLEELGKRFIERYEGYSEDIIMEIDKIKEEMQVERRRIYDILNIYQSLEVVKKVGKNNYCWKGLKEAIVTINKIQNSPYSPVAAEKKEKSLKWLSSRYLRLFLSSSISMTLQQAANLLIKTEQNSTAGNKTRRLYDIVNVFKSLGLVQKSLQPKKKTYYEWLGTRHLESVIEGKRQKTVKIQEFILDQETPVKAKQFSMKGAFLQGFNEFVLQSEPTKDSSFHRLFSKKIFFPPIIKIESMWTINTQDSFNDVCVQY